MDTFIRAAFDELLDTDGLAVMAKGMGIQRLLIKFLQYYSMAQLSTGKKQSMYSSSINNLNNSRHLLSWKLHWRVNCGNHAWFCCFHGPSFHVYVIYWCSVSWRLFLNPPSNAESVLHIGMLRVRQPACRQLLTLIPTLQLHNEEKKVVFCINANGTEDFILNGLLAEGLMPHRLPKVSRQLIRTWKQHLMQWGKETKRWWNMILHCEVSARLLKVKKTKQSKRIEYPQEERRGGKIEDNEGSKRSSKRKNSLQRNWWRE